jgi:hypothetical protein
LLGARAYPAPLKASSLLSCGSRSLLAALTRAVRGFWAGYGRNEHLRAVCAKAWTSTMPTSRSL